MLNRHTKMGLLVLAAATFLLRPDLASAITVDGSAADWGVSGLGSNTADYSGVVGTAWESTSFEGDGYLTPGGGGQNYDVEFVALTVEANTLYGIVLSGQRTDNGFSNYSPGDVFFTAYDSVLGADVVFGLEVDGNTYQLNGSGYTTGVVAGSYAAGTLVRDPGAIAGTPFGNPGTGGNAYAQIGSPGAGTVSLGLVDAFVFNQDASLGQHSVIEFAIALDAFGLGAGSFIKSATWSPSCGNDLGMVNAPPIPEPNGALLMGAGVLIVGTVQIGRRRRA